jgi:hypothetical protein
MGGRLRKIKIKIKEKEKGGRKIITSGWLAKILGRHDAAVAINPELKSKIVFQTK